MTEKHGKEEKNYAIAHLRNSIHASSSSGGGVIKTTTVVSELHCLQKSELLLLVRGRENKN
jgi:hypothetical protein